ncbi:hypothetical protein C8R44DRAFT_22924 [Mycena epipterygia]|nr:hypothetical protein C8R44DRAFT_22924 [Mycena epipterygia]
MTSLCWPSILGLEIGGGVGVPRRVVLGPCDINANSHGLIQIVKHAMEVTLFFAALLPCYSLLPSVATAAGWALRAPRCSARFLYRNCIEISGGPKDRRAVMRLFIIFSLLPGEFENTSRIFSSLPAACSRFFISFHLGVLVTLLECMLFPSFPLELLVQYPSPIANQELGVLS